MSILYVIGTPIGNLGDISFRAVEILKSVDLVACEDTRQTLKLLNHLGIKVPLISCRARNESIASERLVEALNEGKNIAYASDAGTPALSDPGSILVRYVTEAGHTVLPVPGPSAFASLLSVSGSLDKTVIFEGFLSPKPGRRRARLRELMETGNGFVIYESPYRILKLLEDISDLDDERYICVGREMTKFHEEYLRGSVKNVKEQLFGREKQLGEFSVFISGKKNDKLLR